MADLSAPPLPPSVTNQQAPLARFAQQAGGQPGAPDGGAQPGGNALEMVNGILANVAKELEAMAKILVNEKPQLIPILKPAVQALAMLQSEVGQKPQGGSPGGAGPDQGMAQTPQGQGAALSAA